MKNGVGANSGFGTKIAWPKPFKSAPLVWANTPYSVWIIQVTNPSATGAEFYLRSISATNTPTDSDMYIDIYGYGELA